MTPLTVSSSLPEQKHAPQAEIICLIVATDLFWGALLPTDLSQCGCQTHMRWAKGPLRHYRSSKVTSRRYSRFWEGWKCLSKGTRILRLQILWIPISVLSLHGCCKNCIKIIPQYMKPFAHSECTKEMLNIYINFLVTIDMICFHKGTT